MVCLRNISINTLHKGDDVDDDNNNNNNNNNNCKDKMTIAALNTSILVSYNCFVSYHVIEPMNVP